MDKDVEKEIANLRSHLENVISSNDRIYELRYSSQQAALGAAARANDHRLDMMNEFRAAMTDQAGRMVTRTEYVTSSNALNDKIEVIRQPKWVQIGSFVSVIAAMIAGVWLVIGLRIDESVVPVRTTLEIVKATQNTVLERIGINEQRIAASTQSDASSQTDRAQLNARVHEMETSYNTHIGSDSGAKEKLTEIETQLCAVDIFRNLMHTNDMRTMSVLWRKAFPNTPLPTDNAYYPQICNRKTTQ